MMSTRKAVIIGGGIAGPAAALALRKAGISSAVYEAYGNTADGVGGVLSVAPNGLNALAVVGVDTGALGQPIQRQVMMDGNGKRWFEFDGLPGLPASRSSRARSYTGRCTTRRSHEVSASSTASDS
jgi:2-polyprenyl-6-methoxyphenol hydroxylase-like FAD-dependent oxidoreductase